MAKDTNNATPVDIPKKERCFVIMPFSDPDGYESGHFKHVYQDIFAPAIKNAGYEPYRTDDNRGANLIQLEILRELIESPLILCDLSSRNPNVLFELGIRQAFDKPVVLVQETNTPRIFDIANINTIEYRKQRVYHEVIEDQVNISLAIKDTMKSWTQGTSANSIIRLLGINKPANIPENNELEKNPALQYVLAEISELRSDLQKQRNYQRHSAIDEVNSIKNQIIPYLVVLRSIRDKNIKSQDDLNRIEEADAFIEKCYKYISMLPNEIIERVDELKALNQALKIKIGWPA